MTAASRAVEVMAWHPPVPGRQVPDRAAPDWREAALCAQADPEAFFPGKGESVRVPRRICLSCPVREQCLVAGLRSGEQSGIWGGLTSREMREGRLKRRTPAEMIAASDIRAYQHEARIDATRRNPKGLAA